MPYFAIALPLVVILPLLAIYLRVKNGHKSKTPLYVNLVSFFSLLLITTVIFGGQSVFAADAAVAAETAVATSDGLAKGLGYIGAALAVGLSGIGGGIAVSAAAAAALGAISENEKTFGKALIFVGLAEGVALYGLLIAFMIISAL